MTSDPSIDEVIRSVDGAAAVIESGDESAPIVFLNDAFRAVLAIGPGQVEGRPWRTLFCEDDSGDRELVQFIQTAMDEADTTTILCRRRDTNGDNVALLLRLTPLSTPPGDPPCWLLHQPSGTGMAETDNVEMEAETLRVILRSTLDPIVTTNLMGQVLDASDSIERVLGWRPADLIGRSINVLIPPPHDGLHDEYMARYRETGQTNILGRTRQLTARHKDGHPVPIELSVSRVDLPDSRESLLIGIVHDITERVEAERELEEYREHLESLVQERTAELEASHAQLRQADRLASIGTLAAGLGHDMGNILLPMRCRLDSLPAKDLSNESRTHLEAMRQSIRYLQQLADGLHLLSLDPYERDATGHRTNLSQWWDQVGMLLTKSLAHDVRVAVSLPSDLPDVAAAPHRVTQAMLNLIVNAGEAMGDHGNISIVAEHDNQPDFVRIVVQDNGSGMPPDVIKQALDPFFTTKKRGLGTGLGLTLVHGVVRAVGGEIELESTVGEGTTVTLHLPAVHAGATSLRSSPGKDRQCACLSVEDSRIASLITAMLIEAGFYVCDRSDDGGCSCGLWICDAHLTTVEEVTRVQGLEGRTVIVLGGATPVWRITGARIVLDSGDFEELRSSIGEAAVS